MQTITFKASEALIDQLQHVAEKLDRSRGYLIRKAIEGYLADMREDEEDTVIAMQRLSQDDPLNRISLEHIEQK